MTGFQSKWAIGVDLGGTKCAAGLVSLDDRQLLGERRCDTDSTRGGEAILADVAALIVDLLELARQNHCDVSHVGIGIAELVDPKGAIVSDATFDWCRRVPDAKEHLQRVTGLSVRFEADVRAAARAESVWGHGRGRQNFLFVSIGTGISASLVIDGQPFTGARGLTGTFASAATLAVDAQGLVCSSPALEEFASGPALVRRYLDHPSRKPIVRAEELFALADQADGAASEVIISAAQLLGASIGQLVNLLDPELVVLGGGLGVAEGPFRAPLERSVRDHIWSDRHRDLPIVGSALGSKGGLFGAALAGEPVHHASHASSDEAIRAQRLPISPHETR